MSANQINELRALLGPVFQRNKVVRAAIFGSRAIGKHNDNSDYDFLVEFEKSAGWEYFGLPAELEHVLKQKVDVITPWTLEREPELFRDNVLQNARVFYETR